MYCNPRGIDWNDQVKRLPEYRKPKTKTGFLIQEAEPLAVCYLDMNAMEHVSSGSLHCGITSGAN